MGNGAGIGQGPKAGHQPAWRDVYESLSRADESGSLSGDDLELLAAAAYLLGHVDECRHALERAHRAHFSLGDARRAARCIFWVAFTSLLEGNHAQASGWLARAHRLLEHEKEESAEQASCCCRTRCWRPPRVIMRAPRRVPLGRLRSELGLEMLISWHSRCISRVALRSRTGGFRRA